MFSAIARYQMSTSTHHASLQGVLRGWDTIAHGLLSTCDSSHDLVQTQAIAIPSDPVGPIPGLMTTESIQLFI